MDVITYPSSTTFPGALTFPGWTTESAVGFPLGPYLLTPDAPTYDLIGAGQRVTLVGGIDDLALVGR
jgi:hypothetical protein